MGGSRSSVASARIVKSIKPSSSSFGPVLGTFLDRWDELSKKSWRDELTPEEALEFKSFTVRRLTELASQWLEETLPERSIPVYRSVSTTGYGNEGFEGGSFWSLRPEIAKAYADHRGDGRVQSFNIPRGSKIWDISRHESTPRDMNELRRQGYYAVFRPDLMEFIVL